MPLTNLEVIPFQDNTLRVTAIEGPENLTQYIQQLRAKYSPSFFARQQPKEDQLVLYVNRDLHLLILTNGQEHYAYDIANGRSAKLDPNVNSILGGKLHDVSGDEQKKKFLNQDFRALDHHAHRVDNKAGLDEALQNGYKHIMNAKSVQEQHQAGMRSPFR